MTWSLPVPSISRNKAFLWLVPGCVCVALAVVAGRSLSADVVLSASMEPAIKPGSLVIRKDVLHKDYAQGDIVTFKSPSERTATITHRITDLKRFDYGSSVLTKGDGNPQEDPWVLAVGDLKGKVVVVIPYLGYAFNVLSGGLAFVLLSFVSLAALCSWMVAAD